MPGTIIRERSVRAAAALPTSTGTFFLSGQSHKGEVGVPHLIRGMSEFERKLGTRQTYSLAYDVADLFFRQGGSVMYFSREAGAAAVSSSVNLLDGAAGVSLVLSARGPGIWGNDLRAAVIAGDSAGTFKIVLTNAADSTYSETTPSFATNQDAVDYFSVHETVKATLGASALDPAIVAATAFSGGTDDRTAVSDTTFTNSLNVFSKGLGPGQVAAAGRTTSAAHSALLAHAANNNRVALIDLPNVTTKAGLVSAASSVTSLSNSRHGAIFAPWVNAPALMGGGPLRPVPPAGAVAGAIAANDGVGVPVNQPTAGSLGLLTATHSVVMDDLAEVDYEDLNNSSVNMIRTKNGELKIYGYRTAVNKASNRNWWMFSNVRLYMAIAAQADNILESFVLKQIDGRGRLFGQLSGRLTAMLLGFYEQDSLFGETPGDAFRVDVGPQVNTPQTIENGEIRAIIELTMSSMGETVILDVVKRQIGA